MRSFEGVLSVAVAKSADVWIVSAKSCSMYDFVVSSPLEAVKQFEVGDCLDPVFRVWHVGIQALIEPDVLTASGDSRSR